MKKIIAILLLLASTTMFGQVIVHNQPVKLKQLVLGATTDSLVVVDGDGLTKYLPASAIGGNIDTVSIVKYQDGHILSVSDQSLRTTAMQEGAVDLSFIAESGKGGSGQVSFTAGYDNLSLGYASWTGGYYNDNLDTNTLMYGVDNYSSGAFSIVLGGGNTNGSGGAGSAYNYIIGNSNETTTGGGSFLMGNALSNVGMDELMIIGNVNEIGANDKVFIIGTGTYTGSPTDYVRSDPKNGMEIFKDQSITFPQLTNALIDSRGAQSPITKGYFDANSGGPDTPVIIKGDEGSGVGYFTSDQDRALYLPVGERSYDLQDTLTTSVVTTFGTTGKKSATFGADNRNEADASFVAGVSNVNGDDGGYGNFIVGQENSSSGAFAQSSFLAGYLNTNSGAFATNVSGYKNESKDDGHYSFINGVWNSSDTYAGSVIGIGNNIAGNITGTPFVMGQGNDESSNAMFQVANGVINVNDADPNNWTKTVQSNAFEVFYDGNVVAPTLTDALINSTGDQSLTTKGYVDGIHSSLQSGPYTTDHTQNGNHVVMSTSDLITLDDATVNVGDAFNFYNMSGADISFAFGTGDSAYQGTLPILGDGLYAWASLTATNQWSVIIGGAGGGSGGSSTLSGLDDTSISAPGNGNTLIYNSTSGKWENQALAGGGDMLKSVYDTSGVDGVVDDAEAVSGVPITNLAVLSNAFQTFTGNSNTFQNVTVGLGLSVVGAATVISDPTGGNGVGNRDYNDSRYAQLDGNNLFTNFGNEFNGVLKINDNGSGEPIALRLEDSTNDNYVQLSLVGTNVQFTTDGASSLILGSADTRVNGTLTVSSDPTDDDHVVTKGYADINYAGGGAETDPVWLAAESNVATLTGTENKFNNTNRYFNGMSFYKLSDYPTNFLRGTIDVQSDNDLQIRAEEGILFTAVSGIYDFGSLGAEMRLLSDPTSGDHVGNRDYNDSRYLGVITQSGISPTYELTTADFGGRHIQVDASSVDFINLDAGIVPTFTGNVSTIVFMIDGGSGESVTFTTSGGATIYAKGNDKTANGDYSRVVMTVQGNDLVWINGDL